MKLPCRTATTLASLSLALAVLTGCGTTAATTSATTSTGALASTESVSTISLDDTHADADDGEYDLAGATTITLADGASTRGR